ncbi:hypothetical protein [Thiomicrorhabdus sp.]|uniref:hypothetical protein n=1 Tax=Thiomicrorhabdus sp. TaxID=2039724 RepID=UPI0029C7196F|nr:hypothetical protein [Thiomicrorhabdus sp.]
MLNESKVMRMVKAKQAKKQKGASMIEYALVIAGVAIVAALLFGGNGGGTVGSAISGKVNNAINSVETPSGS